MPLTIVRNDITKMNVDVIVNAANTSLLAGGGVCGAIFSAAGYEVLQKACDKLAPIKTGEAVITKGFSLPAKYIIHTAGPVYQDGSQGEEHLLKSSYINSLNLAKKYKCSSIAFPMISTGIYGYPKDEALSVATTAIKNWLMESEMDVSLVVFDKAAFTLSNDLLGGVKSFIDENYVDERNLRFSRRRERPVGTHSVYDVEATAANMSISMFPEEERQIQKEDVFTDCSLVDSSPASAPRPFEHDEPMRSNMMEPPPMFTQSMPPMPSIQQKIGKPLKIEKHKKIDDVLVRLDENFSATLLRLIDAKGKTDVEVYKRANLDRKLFSKIRKGKSYLPSKRTAVALSIALELSLSETRDLLERAGFALSRSVVFDVIIEYFITQRMYDIFEINNVLFEYDQALLGG